MIDISKYTNQIASAIYGRDVRQSIVDGLTACANTAGLEVLGSYASLAELQAAHPTGNTGDYYIAGLDLYYWNGKAWEDVSQFTGVGITGISKTSTAGLVDTYTITFTDSTTQTFAVTNGYTPTLAVHQNADMSVTVTLTDQSGTTTVTIPATSYNLPVASSTDLGGVKSGNDISVSTAGVVSVSHASTAGAAEGYTSDGAIASALARKVAISVAVADVVANTDSLSADYPYCYDYSLTGITSDYSAETCPTADTDYTVWSASTDGSTNTSANKVRIYFTATPTAVVNLTIKYLKAVN